MEQTLIGEVVDGRYLISARLARGGMAVVYRARDKRLERDVAIKVMHPHLAEQPNFTERFHKEARAAARLSSPYVVSVYDQGVWDSQAYLTMEFIPGPDLRSELTRLGSFSLGTALTITEQALAALAAAHSAGLIHRDVKPENIMLAEPLPESSVLEPPDILAKVTDFGLARAVNASSTTGSAPMGTVAYIAPEIITEGRADARSDLYAVGIMLYEFLTGSVPFGADTPIRTAYMHVNNSMPRATDQAPWLPPAIDSFIGSLTAKDPEDRPQDGKAALAQLRSLLPVVAPEDLIRRVPVIGNAPAPTPSSPARDTVALPASHTEALPTAHPDAAAEESQPPTSAPSPTRTDTAPIPLRKRRLWIPLLVLFALAIAGAAAWYFLVGPGLRATVPDVVGETTASAYDALEAQGFTVDESAQYSDDVPADHVISSHPDAGSRAHPDSTVTIAISQGIEQVRVPDLAGQEREDATAAANENRLEVEITEAFSEEVAEGAVISQDIEAGTMVDHSSTITLTVSKGREPIEVPQITGQSRDDAVSAIEDAGLDANVEEEFSDSVAEGTVISQSPSDGTLYRNDPVTITVSKGPELIEVPDVTFASKDDAISTLEDAGFTVHVEELYGGILGIVRFQDPEGGAMAAPGSEITISVM